MKDLPTEEPKEETIAIKPFSFFRASIRNLKPHRSANVVDIYKYITSDYAKEGTEKLRAMTDKKEAKRFKAEAFDYACFSGTLATRNDKDLVEHSGLICIDFDHVPDVEALFQRLLCWKNTSRRICSSAVPPAMASSGLFPSTSRKVPIRVFMNPLRLTSPTHTASTWTSTVATSAGRVSCVTMTGLISIKNYLRNDKKKFNINEWAPEKRESAPIATPTVPVNLQDSDIEIVTQRIEAEHCDITANYQDWVDLAFALAGELGEEGRSYFHRLSRFYPDYDEQEADKKYTSCLQSGSGKVNIRTFLHLAQQAGISVSRTLWKTTFRTFLSGW